MEKKQYSKFFLIFTVGQRSTKIDKIQKYEKILITPQ